MKLFSEYANESINNITVSIDIVFNSEEEKTEFLNDAKKNSIKLKLQPSKYADYEGILTGKKSSVMKFLKDHRYFEDEYTIL